MEKIKSVLSEYTSDEAALFRYALSYCFLLALLPALIVIFYFFNHISVEPTLLLRGLYDFIPQEMIEPFILFIGEQTYTSMISIIVTLVVASVVASKMFYSFMIKSMQDEDYDLPLIIVRIKAYVTFVIFIILLCIMTIIIQYLKVLQSLFLFVSIIVILYAFYRVLSFEEKPISYGFVGAIFSGILITGVGHLFLWFVSYFTSYNRLYGPFASLVVAFLAVYLISSIIYLGYCINHVYGHHYPQRGYKHHQFYQSMKHRLEKRKNRFL